jgi:hypothetical protein
VYFEMRLRAFVCPDCGAIQEHLAQCGAVFGVRKALGQETKPGISKTALRYRKTGETGPGHADRLEGTDGQSKGKNMKVGTRSVLFGGAHAFWLHPLSRISTVASSAFTSLISRPRSSPTRSPAQLVAAGVDVTVIRSWLGQASLEATNHYAQANLETKRSVLEKADPKLRPGKPPRWKREADLLAWLDSF